MPETDHIVNKDTLTLTKPGVMLINVSRGRLIHTRALIEALKSGHMGGVALDVYEEEEGISFKISRERSCTMTNWPVCSPFQMCL